MMQGSKSHERSTDTIGASRCPVAMLVLLLAPFALARPGIRSQLPPVVGESVTPLDAERIPTELRYSFDKQTKQVNFDLPGPGDKIVPPPERLRFWLRGDHSNNQLIMFWQDRRTGAAHELVRIPLDFDGWRHFEIPATNRIYLFYPTVAKIRMSIAPSETSHLSAGVLKLRGMEWVSSKLMDRAMPTQNDLPKQLYDTWGGADETQLRLAKSAGVNMHFAPIDFPEGRPAGELVDYAVRSVRWAHDLGLLAGISFYGTGSPRWLASHQQFLVENELGKRYDRAGGAFLSPWNPAATEFWQKHIEDTLDALKDARVLRLVDVVQICPGEEGEVCYDWNHVWAFEPDAIKAYRAYLAELYKNISALNEDWGSDYKSFDQIDPPRSYYPDREHWVFTDFYRLSMLRKCVIMAETVRRKFAPHHWMWMLHTIEGYPKRFYSARYPIFYARALRQLGYLDIAHLAGLDWQDVQDVREVESLGVRTICEIDVKPTADRLRWTFSQADKFDFDGVFIGVAEPLSEGNRLSALGRLCQGLVAQRRSVDDDARR